MNLAYPQIFARLLAPTRVKQRFFPECTGCSQLQADAMRRNVKKLVLHFGGIQAYSYAGVLVGMRHYSAPPPPARGTSLERWYEEAKRSAENRARKIGGGMGLFGAPPIILPPPPPLPPPPRRWW